MHTVIAKSLTPALFALALLSVAAANADEQHHQPDATNPTPSGALPEQQPQTVPSPQMMAPMMNMPGSSASGMPMMNMMGQGGMGMMGPGGMPMSMQDMGAHLDGVIAFLRAEIGITDAQKPQWEAFDHALRHSITTLKQAQAAVARSAAESGGFLQRADVQEQWLGARLEALKALKTAFAGLQAVLSDDQRKTGETLLSRPLCFGQMGMM